MSKADSLKEAIGWLKVVFGVLVAIDISLIAWLAENYANAPTALLLMAWSATIAATILVAWVFVAVYRHIKALEDV